MTFSILIVMKFQKLQKNWKKRQKKLKKHFLTLKKRFETFDEIGHGDTVSERARERRPLRELLVFYVQPRRTSEDVLSNATTDLAARSARSDRPDRPDPFDN